MNFRVEIEKDKYKFSATHFTILSETEAEPLHGHNYYVQVSVDVKEISKELGMAFPFATIKNHLNSICQKLDERVLIPNTSPYLQVEEIDGQLRVQFQNRKYEFPRDEVALLPVSNITSEELSCYLWKDLEDSIAKLPGVVGFSVGVAETRGQRVTYSDEI